MAGRTLTPKQEAFALHYVEHGNASAAYKAVYKPKPTTKENTIGRTAWGLLENPKIAARIAEVRKPIVEAVGITLENHLRTLEMLRDAAFKSDQFSAAIQAEHHRGKASGIYVDKKQLELSVLPKFLADTSGE